MSKKADVVIQSIREGDNDKALEYLYKDPLRKVRKYILSNSGSLADADDVFQDAVVALFHYVKKNKYKEIYDLDAFLFRVARNAWINSVRKNKKIVSGEIEQFDTQGDNTVEKEILDKEKLQVFQDLFNQLEEACKMILSYVMFEKKSMKEIASLMGYGSDQVAKNQHYRCKKYFAKIVTNNKEAAQLLRYWN